MHSKGRKKKKIVILFILSKLSQNSLDENKFVVRLKRGAHCNGIPYIIGIMCVANQRDIPRVSLILVVVFSTKGVKTYIN